MRPTDENKQTIARLRSEQAFEQARQAEMAGDFELAERKATESLGYMDNQAARSLLDRIGAQVEQSDMMRQAAQAYAAGNYDQAINIYQQVINQFGASADVQRLINQSRVRSAVEKAKVALNSWELATADDLLSEALDIDSTDPEANRLLADLQTRQAYTDRMNRADALRSRGFYGQAKELYAEAIRIAADASMDTSKAQARLDETEFEHLLANAETAIQAEKWQVALSYLEPARKMRQTNEVVEKIRLAQQKLAEEQE
jgi:tetratricopeptide (TPR) repeat protein